MRNNDNLAILWKTIDWELKLCMEQFTEPPRVQWVASNKVRVGLRREEDFRLLIHKVLPVLKAKQMILKNERTGEFLDEDEASSVGGSSVASSLSSLSLSGEPIECVVISDLPSYFLHHDVEDLVRKALKVKVVVGSEVMPIVCKRLEWAMGNPMAPSWQVCAGKGIVCLEGCMLQLSGMGMDVATVVSWTEYSTARAAFRAKAQQRRQDSSGWGVAAAPRPVLNYGGKGKGGGKGNVVQNMETDGNTPSTSSSSFMELDWTLVRGKRARNEQSQ